MHHPMPPEGFVELRPPDTLAVDFANTVACTSCRAEDALASSAELSAWATPRFGPAFDLLGPHELARLRQLRSTVRELLYATVDRRRPAARALRAANLALRGGGRRVELRWSEEGGWSERPSGIEGSDRVAEAVLESTIHLLTGSEVGKLRACRAPECAHLLIARTGSQIWCSPTGCGNRARVARHYWKGRGTRPGMEVRARPPARTRARGGPLRAGAPTARRPPLKPT